MVHIRPKQSLGQNFLVDENISRKIARSLYLTKEDAVIEIGPGQGALTKHLVLQARHLIAVEIDGRVVDELQKSFASPGVTILHQDFLECTLAVWSKKFKDKLRIVGNIPYHLTSPILFKVFDERAAVYDLTMMVQKEVAQRIVAKPRTKSYGILSVLSHFYGTPKILFTVSPNCFYPKPNVTSAVIQMKLHETIPGKVDEFVLKTVVKTTFGKRRKTLRNSLKYLPYEQSEIENILNNIQFSLERRPEELSVEEFIDLSLQITQYIH